MGYLSVNNKHQLAAKFTELALQNGIILPVKTPEYAAKQVCAFYNTVVKNLESTDEAETESET